ncbi:protein Iojap, chloroplastic [Melia azedarach]|uniref:Protein Iojap, chloroplastic n=2 Tax=Melia azedarach TaxID=155640 RepID=A0ACC1YTG5_MELAZ|nr:protein Iojap, chloroplastic [Melia azedarach]KAJ4726640.1 protein Iojap, chloroplastic [Melia azedarach]
MVVSTTLSLAGAGTAAGTRFVGEFQQLGHVEPKLSGKPRKHFGWFCISGHQLLNCKCFWQIPPRSRNLLNFKPRDLPLYFAYGKDAEDSSLSNVNEDTDEMFDKLFKKYGKVVFKRNDHKPPTAEIDDDAESLSFAVAMAKVASDVKAADIKVLFVKPLVYWTRFFIIATAFSRPQIDAIGSRIRDLAEKEYGKVPSGDSKPNSWTLLDFGDVVIHIFLPQQRAFYNLEEFYGNATPIELPFENQPPFGN